MYIIIKMFVCESTNIGNIKEFIKLRFSLFFGYKLLLAVSKCLQTKIKT